ncbi:MAG: D-3-phosphoglycerate dehydrogenase [Bacteriovoracaceae bacterium]|jgi:phosphoglycerate dehydrogenase-like enzyme
MSEYDYDVAVTSRSFSKNQTLRNELLARYKKVKFNDEGINYSKEGLIEYLKKTEKAIIALDSINDEILSHLPDLKIISKYGVGLNNIDFESLRNNKVLLGWKGGVNKRAVAELTLGAMLSMSRNLFQQNSELKSGVWNPLFGRNLSGKSVGIIGLGHIGKEVAKFLKMFGCDVFVYDVKDCRDFCLENGLLFVDFNTLISNSNIITLHVPLDHSTEHMINEKVLSTMKQDVFIINTCRGGVVSELDLLSFLDKQPHAKAFFDVFESEPAIGNKLLDLNNFISSPHIGGTTEESVLAMGRSAIENLENAIEANEESFR